MPNKYKVLIKKELPCYNSLKIFNLSSEKKYVYVEIGEFKSLEEANEYVKNNKNGFTYIIQEKNGTS